MLLGHTAFAEQAFQDPRLDAVHNIEFAETGFDLTYKDFLKNKKFNI